MLLFALVLHNHVFSLLFIFPLFTFLLVLILIFIIFNNNITKLIYVISTYHFLHSLVMIILAISFIFFSYIKTQQIICFLHSLIIDKIYNKCTLPSQEKIPFSLVSNKIDELISRILLLLLIILLIYIFVGVDKNNYSITISTNCLSYMILYMQYTWVVLCFVIWTQCLFVRLYIKIQYIFLIRNFQYGINLHSIVRSLYTILYITFQLSLWYIQRSRLSQLHNL